MSDSQEEEIKRLTKLFLELPSISLEDAKQCVKRVIKLEIELLEAINKDKFIVHWSMERYQKLINDKYKLLSKIEAI